MADYKFWVSNAILIVFSFNIIPETIPELTKKAVMSFWGLFRWKEKKPDEEGLSGSLCIFESVVCYQ